MKKLAVFAVLVAGLLSVSTARAALITGHADITGGGDVDGTINYVVLSGADPLMAMLLGAFTPGAIGSPAFAPAPTDFVYLYQAVNDGLTIPLPKPLSNMTISILPFPTAPPVSPSAWGSFAGLIMTDAGIPIGPSAGPNPNDGPGFDLDGPLGPTPFSLVPAGGLISPFTVLLTPSSLSMNWAFLPVGGISEIVGFVSPIPPRFDFGSLQNGGVGFNGSVVTTPAPGAALLAGIGLVMSRRIRRRKTA